MNRKEALRIAQDAVGAPVGNRTSWQVSGPYYYDQPSGPCTSSNHDSYAKALRAAAAWKAEIAITLLGGGEDQCYVVEKAFFANPWEAAPDWRDVVRTALKK